MNYLSGPVSCIEEAECPDLSAGPAVVPMNLEIELITGTSGDAWVSGLGLPGSRG